MSTVKYYKSDQKKFIAIIFFLKRRLKGKNGGFN